MIQRLPVDPLDVAALLAFLALVVGIGVRFGWDVALIVGGAVVLALVLLLARSSTEGRT